MAKTISKYLSLFFVTLSLFWGFSQIHAAQAATLYFSPSQKTIQQGQEFTLTIMVNTGSIYANAVGLNISYPKDKLEAKSITTSGSALTIFAEREITEGLVKISGGTPTPGFSGTKTIASINFLAKASSGAAQIKFVDETVVLKDSDNTDFLDLKNSGIATVNFTSFSSTPTPPPAGKDIKAPQISEIEVKDITKNSVTISWKTNEDSDSQVEYGLTSGQYNFVWTSPTTTKEHIASISNLPPGERFYFLVSSRDAAGNIAKSSEQTFSILGYKILIKYRNEDGQPLASAEVTLFYASDKTKTGTTDEAGQVIFDDVMPGKLLVIANYEDSLSVNKIVILPDKDFQIFNLTFSSGGMDLSDIELLVGIGLSIVVVLILFLIVRKIIRKFRNKGGNEEPKRVDFL